MSTSIALPELASPYREALAECVDGVMAHYDVLAILVTGTIIRGNPDRRSDLDLHVLHRGDFRERCQEWHCGVPCEIFVNPPSRIEKYFEEDVADRRPIAPHMYATGIVLYDPEHVLPELSERGRSLLENPPELDRHALIARSYSAATMLEDALDLYDRDPESAVLVLGDAVWSLCQCRISAEPGWLPRPKDLLARVREVDPESARLALQASLANDLAERFEAARNLSLRITGAEGFFEWTSPREVVQ